MIDEIIDAIGSFIGLILDEKEMEMKRQKKYKIISTISVIIILFLIGFGIYAVFFR